jgi:hypothetical protein
MTIKTKRLPVPARENVYNQKMKAMSAALAACRQSWQI